MFVFQKEANAESRSRNILHWMEIYRYIPSIMYYAYPVIVMFMYVVELSYWRFYLCVVIPAIVCNL
jgi:hypothetical protein